MSNVPTGMPSTRVSPSSTPIRFEMPTGGSRPPSRTTRHSPGGGALRSMSAFTALSAMPGPYPRRPGRKPPPSPHGRGGGGRRRHQRRRGRSRHAGQPGGDQDPDHVEPAVASRDAAGRVAEGGHAQKVL